MKNSNALIQEARSSPDLTTDSQRPHTERNTVSAFSELAQSLCFLEKLPSAVGGAMAPQPQNLGQDPNSATYLLCD